VRVSDCRTLRAASSRFYFRFHFGFSLEDSIACAETSLRQSLKGLGVQIPDGDQTRLNGALNTDWRSAALLRDKA
jgi:hypothetical protein